jgi:hypothetical protein
VSVAAAVVAAPVYPTVRQVPARAARAGSLARAAAVPARVYPALQMAAAAHKASP